MECRAEDITRGLRELGLKAEDSLIVHSSLRSLGTVLGGPNTVINSIYEVIGDKGALLVPTLTGKREDSKENPPIFDVKLTAGWTGIIAETVRGMEGAKRSYHPTHSVAGIGGKTEGLIEGHEKSYSPCDYESPYYKLAKAKGYILLIGVDQESNTAIHSCEELAGVPYHLQEEITSCYIRGYFGETIEVKNRLHNWNKEPTDFNKLDRLYYNNGIMKISKICGATIRLINAAEMFDTTIRLLKAKPFYLIKDFK